LAGGGDAGGGFAGAAALGDIAGVVGAELHGAGEVGVAGPGPGDRIELLGVLDPVHDLEREDAAEGMSLAHPGDDFRLVLFELHPGAAAVASLAAGKLGVDRLGLQGCRGGALDGGDQASVRLARGSIARMRQEL
jgi:hypothetical protein